jgi:autotransporter-associated beta strand protein
LTTGTLNVGGNFTLANANGLLTAGSASTVIYNGAGSQSVAAASYGNLTVNKSAGTATASGSFTVNTVFTIQAGTFDASSATVTLAGSGTPLVVSGTLTASTSTVTYTSASGATVAAVSYNNAVVNGTGTFTAANNFSMAGGLTVTAGTFDPSGHTITGTGGNTLSVTGTLLVDASTFAGNFASFATPTLVAGSTVQYTNTNPTINAAPTYQNLAFSGSGTAGSSGTLTVQGTLSNTGGGALNFGASAVTLSGGNTQSIAAFTTTGTFTCGKNGGTATLQGNTSCGVLNVSTTGGTLNLGTTLAHAVSGDFTISAGTLNASSSTATIGGNWARTAGTFTSGTSTFDFTKASGTQTLNGGGQSFFNITHSGAGTLQLLTNALTTTNSFNNSGGSTVDLNGVGLTVGDLQGTGTITSGVAGSITVTAGSDNASTTFSGIIQNGSGTVAVTKNGTGTWTLSGDNAYSGLTTISVGTLKLGAAGGATNTPLGTTVAGTSVTAGAALDLNGFTLGTTEALTLNGTGISSGGALTNSSATNVTYTGLVTLGSTGVSIATNAGSINLSNAGTITGSGFALTLGGTGNGSLSSIIGTGTGTLTKSGTGTWTLSGSSTYTGTTTISAGTLKLGAAGGATNTPLGTTGAGTSVTAGAALDLNGFTLGTAEGLTLNGTGISSGGALTNSSATGATYSGLIALGSTGVSIVTNAGDINLSNVGTITGSGFALTLGGTGNGSLSSIIGTAAGTLTKSGTGTWTLSGSSTYTGLTTISAGILKLGAAGVSPNTPLGTTGAGTSVSAGGAIDLNGFTLATAEALTLNGTGVSSGGALTNSSATTAGYPGLITLGSASSIIASSGTINISNVGTITGATFGLTLGGAGGGSVTSIIGTTTGSLTKNDAGTWTLSGSNTFTGGVTINGGILQLNNAGALNSGTANAVTFGAASTGKLQLNGISPTIASLNTNATVGTPVIEDGNAVASILTLNSGGANVFEGVLQNGTTGTLALTKSGAGSLTLDGNNTYSGLTTLSAGTLNINSATALGTGTFTIGAGVIDNTSAGAITLTNNNVQNWNADFTFTGTQSLNLGTGTVAMSASRQLTVSANTLTVGGIISGSTFGLTKLGAGTLALYGANAFTGGTTLNAGTLNINNAQALGTVAGTFTIAGGTIDNTSGGAITTLSYPQSWTGNFVFTGTQNLNLGTGAVSMSASRQVTVNANTLTVGGIISGSGFSLTKAGAGALTLGGTNAFTGGTTLSAGTLNINNSQALGASGTFTISGGTIDNTSAGAITTLNYPQSWNGNFTFTGTQNLNLGSGAVAMSASRQVTVSASTLTVGGIISGSTFSLTKAGAGALALGGTNTFTGGTTLNAGTLNINNAQALGTAAGTFTIAGGTIDNTTAGAITTLNYPQAWNGDFTFTGSQNLNLGTGAVTLSADRQVTVNAKKLTVGGTISASTLSLTKAGTDTLSFGSNAVTLNNCTISGGTLIAPSSTLTLAGNWNNSGNFNANGGTVVLNGTGGQTMSGSTFNNLTINDASGITLLTDETINGTLTLTSGNMTTGAHTVIIGSSGSVSRTSGHVVGNLQMNFGTGDLASTVFHVGTASTYTPATLDIDGTGGTAGTITATTAGSAHPDIANSGFNTGKDVERFWTLTPGTASLGATRSYKLKVEFLSGDVPGGANPSAFEFRKYDGSWLAPTGGTYTRTATSTEYSNFTSFSDYSVGEACTPPTTANAGPDQTVCATTATLAGNTPSVGTGAWRVIAGSATVTDTTLPGSGVTGLSVGANTFVWSISSPPCGTSSDTVTITSDTPPTTASAGPDQTVCSTTATLAGNSASVGTGAWTVIAGSATVTAPGLPTSGVTGLSDGANSFVWTISNGVCPASADTVTITRDTPPTTASAGPDQAVCATATALAGNSPTVGTGAWTVIAGSATVTAPGDPASGVTGLTLGSNSFVWTISNGVCPASRDTVTVTRDASPTISNAGSDETVCSTTATLAGNAPSVGTGAWTVVAGSATVTTPGDPTSGVTGLTVGANTFVWTISNGVCPASSDTVTITRDESPTASNAGSDQTVCSITATLSGNTPSVGAGAWTVIAGSATVTTPGNPTSGVTGLTVGGNTFVWTISNGLCPASTDTVTITRDESPSTAYAGPDQTVCAVTATLAGNTPTIGTGGWSVIAGSAAVTIPGDPTSGVTGLSVGANSFVWTITNGSCPPSADTVTITRDETPTTANAGPDQTVCAATATLAGNTPTVGAGAWTVTAGSATVTTPSDPTSGVTGLSLGANSFVWTVTNASCPASRDTVIITRDESPTAANAGPDQTVCATAATFAGNTPTVGTGAWVVIAGSSTVTTPSDPTSGVTGLSVGANTFVWTISNGVCPASGDTITITRDESPTTANAGSDQTVCATTATLAGNAPTVGTGAWTVIAGSATVTAPGEPASGVTALSVGANSFVWTVTNASCPPSRDTVTISRDESPTTANAGSDQTVCSTTATLAGNTPSVGSGAWTVIAGSSSVTTPGDPTSGVTGLSVGANTFVWTISNGVCPSSSDTVTVTRDESPTAANAGPDQAVCGTTATLAGNRALVGTGVWTVLTGSATVTTPGDSTSGVTGLSVGLNSFVWTITNGTCPPSRDTVTITRDEEPTTANAGPDQTVCSTTATLAANTPVVGTGEWTVIAGSSTVTTPGDPASGVTGLSIGANTFVWTISNNACPPPSRDTITITRDESPTTANAGPDQQVCAASATLAGNAPTVGTGAWTVIAGSATVTTPGDSASGVSGLSAGANSFVWTISNGVCPSTKDTVTITRDASPTTSNAGPDEVVCSAATSLAGNFPTVGTGAWTVIAGSATVTSPADPASGVTGLTVGANTFVWTVSNGVCPPSKDTVTITRDQSPTTANAGPDQTGCSTTATLAGNPPAVGTGAWTVIAGSATVTTPADPASGVTGLTVGVNTFVWAISNGVCPASRDTVTITRDESPTASNAGPDQTACSTTATLAGNTATVGTGAWTVIAGSATVTAPGNPASGVTNLSVGANSFVWTISNGVCPASSDTITITRDQSPTTANAGPDQAVCSTTTTLAGNTPAVGTGAWTVIAGSATVTTPADPASGITGLSVGANSFVWTITNASCPPSRDTVTVTRDQSPTTAAAGSDQTVCSTGSTLAGNSPSVGSGAWTVIAGSSTVTTPSSPSSGVSALSVGANTFVWTISNGVCPASRDTVTITRDASPTSSNAGPDHAVCSTSTTLAGNTPGVGTGAWTVIAGGASVTTPGSPTSGVTGLTSGANTFVWTITNASCPPSRDTVTITSDTPPTTANAGPDQTVCAATATLAGNTPTVGAGAWTVIAGSATVTTPASASSGVTGLSIGANSFVWTISNASCPPSRDTVTITRDASPTTANAGTDQTVCSVTATLAGNAPTVGTGAWSVIAGSATVTTPASPTSGVTGLSVGANRFVWTISNASCPASKDTVSITRDQSPTTANAGSDQTACSTTATLSGNAPAVGTGVWTVVAGSATVTTPGSATTGVTGLTVGANTFVWTISNGSCPPSSDTVTVDRSAPIVVNPATLPHATVSVPYSQTISSTGGTAPHMFTTQTPLPPNLTLSLAGALNGTPTTAGSYTFTVNDTDAHLCTGSRSYTLVVDKEATTSTLTQSSDLSFEGESVDFRDSVAGSVPDGGQVQFKDNGSDLGTPVSIDGNGVAVFSTSALTAGNHTITAFYGGTSNFDSSLSNEVVHTVAILDSTRYRTAKFEDWALASDQKHALKSVKRKNDKVDFKLVIVAPRKATGFTLALNLFSRGAVTRGKTKIDTLHPAIAWDSLKVVSYSAQIDSLDTLQIDGRGFKGSLISVKVTWASAPKAVSVTYKAPAQFLLNRRELPMPNLNNVGEELFPKGAGNPSPVFPLGMLVGIPQGTKKAHSVILFKYSDVRKSMIKRTKTGDLLQSSGSARCLDFFDLSGAPNPAKPIASQQKSLAPDKHKNKLFGELLALKLSVAASIVNKFPNGLGELTFDDESDPSNPFNNQTVNEIIRKVDTLLGCLPLQSKLPTPDFSDAYSVVRKIDSAFSDGTIDTISFAVKTSLKGVRRINDVPYLHRTQGIIPLSIIDPPYLDAAVPLDYRLDQNYPNPFNPTTTIQFFLPEQAVVSLRIYNILGQEVATMLDHEQMDDGEQVVDFDANRLASGVYFYQIVAQGVANEDEGTAGQFFTQSKRMLLVK